MTFDALRRTLDDTVAAAREHADALDQVAAELADTPDEHTLLDRLGGRPSVDPN